MQTDLPTQALAAVATLVAALIAGAISFVNLTLTKELKTSEFRQAWINGLRDDLSVFLGAARTFARAIETVNEHGEEYEKIHSAFRIAEGKTTELRYQAAEMLSRVKLRLNPDEPEHVELLRLLKKAVDKQNEMVLTGGNVDETLAALDAATEYARPVLKKEWRRVKEGELAFRVARNWVVPFIVATSIALLIFIWFGTFKA